jgi:hypothetical protein
LAEDKRLICASADLAEAGRGYRFTVTYGQLDWLPGEFFDDSKLYLVCSVHGALYAPDSGRCLGGRCQGKGLTTLAVDEVDGQVYLLQEIAHG